MSTGFDLLAVPLKGDSGWFVLEAEAGEMSFDRTGAVECQAQLPRGWLGKKSSGKPVMFSVKGGQSSIRVRLMENVRYHWELQDTEQDNSLQLKSRLQDSSRNRWTVTKRNGALNRGSFFPVNYLGTAALQFYDGTGAPVLEFSFEVISRKLDFDSEFRAMTGDIANFCQQLLLEWDGATGLSFNRSPSDHQRLILEQFIFLRSFLNDEKLARVVEAVKQNPHTRLQRETSWKPASSARSSDFLADQRMCREWRRTDAGRCVPGEVLDVRKSDSTDTDPNRFLLFAFTQFRSVCEEVLRFLEKSDKTGSLTYFEAERMRTRIDGALGDGFFRGLGRLSRLPLDNQTLQKREGYREILRSWLLVSAAASLDWEGNRDCYKGEIRDVATLYEYWLFISLYTLLKQMPEMECLREHENSFITVNRKNLTVHLQKGRRSHVNFVWRAPDGFRLRVVLYYERHFNHESIPGQSGSYTRRFKPDYTLTVYPEELQNEASALAVGRLAHLHFDSKYRAETLRDVIGDENDEDASQEDYKTDDLLKMHSYNDAVRHTGGSYVLYPGMGNEASKKPKYHEILPGVGAFVMKPGNRKCFASLSSFIRDALNHQADRYSQFRYLAESERKIFREKPRDFEQYTVAAPSAMCVTLWLRQSDQAAFKSLGFAYCHAVPSSDTVNLNFDLATEIGSEIVPCKGDRRGPLTTIGWRAKITGARFISQKKLREYIDAKGAGALLKPQSAEHYLLYEFSEPGDFPELDISDLHEKYRSGSRYMAVSFPYRELIEQVSR